MAQRTIVLKGKLGRRYEEARMGVAGYPGYLIDYQSNGKIKPHDVRGGRNLKAFLVEDDLQGKTIEDQYVVDDLGRFVFAEPGDIINGVLHAGENVSRGDWVISYGDGTLCKAAASFLANVVADSDTTAAGTTEVAFSNGTVTIPKNSLKVGDVIRVRATVFVADNNSTDTLTVRLKIGSTVIIATAAVDVADNDVGIIDASLVIRTIGASGTFIASGTQSLGVPGTVTAKPWQLGSTAVDTTADNSLTVTAQWSVSHADNDAILRSLIVEHVKAGSSVTAVGGGGDVVGQVETAVDLSAEIVNDFVPILIG